MLAKARNTPYRVFELKVSLKTLQERDRTREGVREGLRPALGDEEIEKVYKTIQANPYSNAISLDTEHLTLEDCIALIDKQFIK